MFMPLEHGIVFVFLCLNISLQMIWCPLAFNAEEMIVRGDVSPRSSALGSSESSSFAAPVPVGVPRFLL